MLGLVTCTRHSTSTVADNPVMTDTGMLGAYFRSDAGIVRVDTSLIGGVSLHNSVRSTGIETATADFASWFLAPEIDGTIPISPGSLETSADGQGQICGRSSRGIHQTGPTANLTVGSQPIRLLDVRSELNAQTTMSHSEFGDVALSAKLGAFSNRISEDPRHRSQFLARISYRDALHCELRHHIGAAANLPLSPANDITISVNTSARKTDYLGQTAKCSLPARNEQHRVPVLQSNCAWSRLRGTDLPVHPC